jgi:hypothetical protein
MVTATSVATRPASRRLWVNVTGASTANRTRAWNGARLLERRVRAQGNGTGSRAWRLVEGIHGPAATFASATAIPREHAVVGRDGAQTALMKIFARAERFEPGLPSRPWFYATLANELRTAVRRDRRQAGRFAPYDPIACPAGGASVDPEALLVDKELAVALEDAIIGPGRPSSNSRATRSSSARAASCGRASP